MVSLIVILVKRFYAPIERDKNSSISHSEFITHISRTCYKHLFRKDHIRLWMRVRNMVETSIFFRIHTLSYETCNLTIWNIQFKLS